MNIDKYYQDGRYADMDGSSIRQYNLDKLKVIEKVINLSFLSKNANVLDVGCGDGTFGRLLMEKFGFRVSGMDISKTGVSLAKKNGIKAIVADASEKLPYKNGEFEIIFMIELIEHLIDPDSFLKECRRILKKNGVLILATPNLHYWVNRILFLFGIYPLFAEVSTKINGDLGFFSRYMHRAQIVGHIRIFNYISLKRILENEGFKAEKASGMTAPFQFPNIFVLTRVFRIVDALMSRSLRFCADMVVNARKI